MAITDRVLKAANMAEVLIKHYAKYDNDYKNAGMPKDFKRLGSGAYGIVFELDTDSVLKVCLNHRDAYPAYAIWCSNNPGPNIPEIYFHVRVDENLFMCAMPKYMVLDAGQENRIIKQRDLGYSKTGAKVSVLSQSVRNVLDVFDGIAQEDMHTGNFMYCPWRDEIIITDPFASLHQGDNVTVESTFGGTVRVVQNQVQMALSLPQRKNYHVFWQAEYTGPLHPKVQQIIDDYLNDKLPIPSDAVWLFCDVCELDRPDFKVPRYDTDEKYDLERMLNEPGKNYWDLNIYIGSRFDGAGKIKP
jgi:hypothetical protein